MRPDDKTSEPEETAHALYEQREWLRVTLSSIGDAVITTDINGATTFLNPVAESLTGWTLADAVVAMSTRIETLLRLKFERPTFGVLMLVICCANVANLLAARSLARRSERAMRAALGASSGALWWQYAIEVTIPR